MREGPNLTMQILEGHGIEGKVLARASVGQRITLDIELKDTGNQSNLLIFQEKDIFSNL